MASKVFIRKDNSITKTESTQKHTKQIGVHVSLLLLRPKH